MVGGMFQAANVPPTLGGAPEDFGPHRPWACRLASGSTSHGRLRPALGRRVPRPRRPHLNSLAGPQGARPRAGLSGRGPARPKMGRAGGWRSA